MLTRTMSSLAVLALALGRSSPSARDLFNVVIHVPQVIFNQILQRDSLIRSHAAHCGHAVFRNPFDHSAQQLILLSPVG